jgi:hypothetical protein
LANLVLLSSPSPIERHVVFIHGVRLFGSNPWRSSGHPREIWPSWLGIDIPGLAVWSVDYDASPTRWAGHAMSGFDRASNVIDLLLTESRLSQGDVAFVAHSFGGLIAEEILRIGSDRAGSDPEARLFLERVSRVMFLGTPHKGASLATWGSLLRTLVLPSAIAAGLTRNDPDLRGLNLWFRHFSRERGIATRTLVEMRRSYGFRIVPHDSADAGLLTDPTPVDADHFGIASPPSRDSEIYRHVLRFLTPLRPLGRLRLVPDDALHDISTTAADTHATVRRIETILATPPTNPTPTPIPRELADAEVERQVSTLRQRRFFPYVETEPDAIALADRLQHGALSGASSTQRARGLAWCARLLSRQSDRALAEDLVASARSLDSVEEISVAEGFLLAYGRGLDVALTAWARAPSASAKSAALIAVNVISGSPAALDWHRTAGLSHSDLTPEGRYALLSAQLTCGRVQEALASAQRLTSDDFADTPALLLVSAAAFLAAAMDHELTSVLLGQPPLVIAGIPLGDDSASLAQRRMARDLFRRAAAAAQSLGCRPASLDAADRALILALRDPQEQSAALDELVQSMRDPATSLRRVPLALGFGLTLDLEAVEAKIDQEIALTGGDSLDAALARVAILRTRNPRDALDYIALHGRQLARHINNGFLVGIELELLVECGRLQAAEERLAEVVTAGLPRDQHERLASLIAEAKASDPVAYRETLFEQSGSLADLQLLVALLKERNDWPRLARYASLLFSRTRTLDSLFVCAHAFFEANDFQNVVALLAEHSDLRDQSPRLVALFAWSLYSVGDVMESRRVLGPLRMANDTPRERALAIHAAIASGDWSWLVTFAEQEWASRHDRTPRDLLSAGQLSDAVGGPRTEALIREAASRADDNAEVLVGCYSSAVSGGWEDKSTFQWLERAALLSGSDGPVQRMTLAEVLQRQPLWQQRETDTHERLVSGHLPLFACARALNRSVIDMTLLPALANGETLDPRRRVAVHGYSGSRREAPVTATAIAIDPVALLILSMLGLLERALGSFATVWIPHSTLGWLFEESRRSRFHQPSRLVDAREIRRLLSAGVLQILEPTASTDPKLSSEVGDELASFCAHIEAHKDTQRPRRILHSGPIHLLTSLMEEEADLGSHAGDICGCLDLVDALVRLARLTQQEESRAKAFLSLHERRHPTDQTIAPGSVVYVTSSSLAHLMHLRLLDKVQGTGLELMVSVREAADADRRLRYQHLSDRVAGIIEDVRRSLSGGVEKGVVRLAPRIVAPESDGNDGDRHPSVDILEMAGIVSAVVIDDRFFNRHRTAVSSRGDQAAVHTTLDLLDRLGLTEAERAQALASLRVAALAFVPLREAEITSALNRCLVEDGVVVETAELKAIRESLLVYRMADSLQLPSEAVWLDSALEAMAATLKSLWHQDIDPPMAAARSNWLLGLMDVRAWFHRYPSMQSQATADLAVRAQIVRLMLTGSASATTRRAYWEWLEGALLGPLRERQPALFAALVEDAARLVDHVVTRGLEEDGRAT